MKMEVFAAEILWPGLRVVEQVCGIPATEPAAQFLAAICKQESNIEMRYQRLLGDAAGPARGWAQFEVGGVKGVLTHQKTAEHAAALCDRYHVTFRIDHVWRAIEGHDGLAIGLARLLVLTDPAPMPREEEVAWWYYKRTWRPGKPDRTRWTTSWEEGQTVRSENG